MANQVSSFMSGAQLILKINGFVYGYAQGMNFSESMNNVPVTGLGYMNPRSIEPVSYSGGRGSFTNIMHESFADDMLRFNKHFNPVYMIISSTFDIELYQKTGVTFVNGKPTDVEASILFTLKDCRLTNYGGSYNVGQIFQPSIDFVCTQIIEHNAT